MLIFIPFIFALAAHAQNHVHALPHMDLEMTSVELESMLAQRPQKILALDAMQPILEMGKRNLEWISHINSKRPSDQQLVIHSPATQKGYPIDQASKSNRQIISERLTALKAELPQAMWDIIYSGAPFTDEHPLADDASFLDLARKADGVYNSASRWILQEPYLSQYAMRQREDIRGYYYLQREPGRDQKLAGYKGLDAATKARLKELLIGQCINQQGTMFKACENEFSSSVERSGNAFPFFQKYLPAAQRTWNRYFDIQNARRDAVWTSANPSVFTFPFLKPAPDVQHFLSFNIEDEWKLGGWKLKMDFQPSGTGLAHVVFVPGATPNVNGLGGSRITMDANRPLDEWTNRWTIRHEFGHVLGLPDCYVEFYDQKAGVMINYQLDIENLMCSRRGKFQQLHFDELEQHYLK